MTIRKTPTRKLKAVGFYISYLMTSAHRPTWNPVQSTADGGGGGSKLLGPTRIIRERDLPSHKKLKVRCLETRTREDFLKDLRTRETKVYSAILGDEAPANPFPEDEDAPVGEGEEEEPDHGGFSSSEEESSDEEEQLLRELQKIEAEKKAAADQQREMEEAIQAEKDKEAALTGNPLLRGEEKSSWLSESVFRNQANVAESKKDTRFLNDCVRSEFHKNFLNKYIH